MNPLMSKLDLSPLGLKSQYSDNYDASLLFPIPRIGKREEIGITTLPFSGYDIWNAYELSWLDLKGKPVVALGNIIFPCESENIIESKSLKLYLNSFNNSKFENFSAVEAIIENDLSKATNCNVAVKLIKLRDNDSIIKNGFDNATLIDELDIACTDYTPNPKLLTTNQNNVSESLYSNLLKSNCLVTNQPDWASVYVKYQGKQIEHDSLLKYIVSFRNHNEFHEQCVERIFVDIMNHCQPKQLTVYARYTRRGGIDINPLRTNCNEIVDNARLARQ